MLDAVEGRNSRKKFWPDKKSFFLAFKGVLLMRESIGILCIDRIVMVIWDGMYGKSVIGGRN
jgi:hypothetical protein